MAARARPARVPNAIAHARSGTARARRASRDKQPDGRGGRLGVMTCGPARAGRPEAYTATREYPLFRCTPEPGYFAASHRTPACAGATRLLQSAGPPICGPTLPAVAARPRAPAWHDDPYPAAGTSPAPRTA